MRRRAMIVASLLIPPGCGESRPGPEPVVPIAGLPAGALKAAREKFPDFRFEKAWKVKARDGEEAFEVQGRNRKSGRMRDLKVTADGRVLEVD